MTVKEKDCLQSEQDVFVHQYGAFQILLDSIDENIETIQRILEGGEVGSGDQCGDIWEQFKVFQSKETIWR